MVVPMLRKSSASQIAIPAMAVCGYTDPVTKGMWVFHCHLLNHEDKGMMAKILVQ
jgi:hypothetical protein